MTELDRLPPDQRAVLSLVLDRGKSYAQVAQLLSISESAVRERAHAALDALARATAAAPSGAPSSGVARARPPAAPAGRGGDLRGGGPLDGGRERMETGPSPGGATPSGRPSLGGGPTPSGRPSPGGGPSLGAPSAPPPATRGPLSSPSSRMGGALLLGAIVAAIVVAVILVSGGGGGKSSGQTATGTANTRSSTSTSSAAKPTLDKTIALTPLEPSLKAAGTAYVLSESKRRAFYVAARGLPPSSGFFYAVWLYNSPSSSAPLGRAPTVGSDGRMEGGGPLPSNSGQYRQLIITRETSTHPSHPGPIVLRGTYGLR
jgi:sigma-70-like protein/anti-sigma-K factor RskA